MVQNGSSKAQYDMPDISIARQTNAICYHSQISACPPNHCNKLSDVCKSICTP
jgi:hypothetical protein